MIDQEARDAVNFRSFEVVQPRPLAGSFHCQHSAVPWACMTADSWGFVRSPRLAYWNLLNVAIVQPLLNEEQSDFQINEYTSECDSDLRHLGGLAPSSVLGVPSYSDAGGFDITPRTTIYT
jgi:hypothetical protein